MSRVSLGERVLALRAQREAAHRRRRIRTVARREGVRCEVDGRELLNFCSNDYLGLSQQFEVIAALQDAAGREGAGSTASHLVCGHHSLHEQLEREMADWLGYPRALLFDSGFMANLAVLLLALASLVIAGLVLGTVRGLREGTLLAPEPAGPTEPAAASLRVVASKP